MASADFRQEILDQLYNVLKDPVQHGDKFLLQITKTPKDGLVSVNLLYNMAKVLNPYPLDYIQHCIPLDIKQRFKWNSDASRVGLKENVCYFETDAFGFSTDLLDNEQDTTEDGARQKVMPVLYDNGRFYIDNEHSRLKGQDIAKCMYKYKRLDIDPLGPKETKGKSDSHALNQRTCFNCGEAGHNVSDCPLPHDKRQIAKRRREFADENIRTKRIHECIETKLKVDSFKPGVLSRSLQDALDITMPPGEPPYYAQMRYHGYPPGYLGFAYEKEETPLKTYENEQDYKQAEEMIENQNKDTLIELVEYSGLQFINTSQLEKHLNQGYSQLQQEQELQRQEQDWEYYYYEYSMNAQTDYPPGTLQTEYPPPETIQSVYLPPETVQTYSSFRNIETINQSVTVPDTVTCSIHTVDTLIEDNQSVDMEISSDDEE